MTGFRVTYETITEESAADGESADNGWCAPGGWRFPVDDPGPHEMSLREAIDMVSCVEDSGRWFSEVDGSINYRTGETEFKSLHPPSNITGSSYRRVARLLGVR